MVEFKASGGPPHVFWEPRKHVDGKFHYYNEEESFFSYNPPFHRISGDRHGCKGLTRLPWNTRLAEVAWAPNHLENSLHKVNSCTMMLRHQIPIRDQLISLFHPKICDVLPGVAVTCLREKWGHLSGRIGNSQNIPGSTLRASIHIDSTSQRLIQSNAVQQFAPLMTHSQPL